MFDTYLRNVCCHAADFFDTNQEYVSDNPEGHIHVWSAIGPATAWQARLCIQRQTSLQVILCGFCTSGHTHSEVKLDCAFTPSDAHVVSGSEDGTLFHNTAQRVLRRRAATLGHVIIDSIWSAGHVHPAKHLQAAAYMADHVLSILT